MFDTTLKKEIRKKCLPEPNPQKVSIPRFATIMMVLEKVRDLYIGGGTRVAMPPPPRFQSACHGSIQTTLYDIS